MSRATPRPRGQARTITSGMRPRATRPDHPPAVAVRAAGGSGSWCSQERSSAVTHWASVFGLVGTPFWFWASWKAEQWGIFALSAIYGLARLRGLWVHWIRPAPPSA